MKNNTKINHNSFKIQTDINIKNERKAFFVIDYCAGGELFNILHKKGKLSEN